MLASIHVLFESLSIIKVLGAKQMDIEARIALRDVVNLIFSTSQAMITKFALDLVGTYMLVFLQGLKFSRFISILENLHKIELDDESL